MPAAKPTNAVHTSKYSIWSFLPLNLFFQLTKLANLYFVVVIILQLIPQISNSYGKPTYAYPLAFVMSVSMVKDFFEDRARRISDDQENNKVVRMEDGNSKKWGELGIGDVIIVSQGEHFPADVVIVDVSDGEKLAFVETKNLDGETNLKSKICPTLPNGARLPQTLNGWVVQCEPPSDKIYQFNGVLSNGRGVDIALSYDNFCLRGSSLRNTEYVVGIVTFTGSDTKVMRNSVPSAQKQSKLEYETGKYILQIFLTMLGLCLVAAIYIQIYDTTNSPDYLQMKSRRGVGGFFTTLFTWILILANLVPISLLVTIELVKFAQAYFITWDAEIFSVDKDMPTKVQSNNLIDQLGQINYIFSDKTGTLTQNIMEFRQMSIGT